MSIADLSNVLKIFGNSDIDPGQQKELFKEALLMTLARASSSDASSSQPPIDDLGHRYQMRSVVAHRVRPQRV